MRSDLTNVAMFAVVVVVACSETTAPTTIQPGVYPLVGVNGKPLPVQLMPNGCPASFTSGVLTLAATGAFNVTLNWQGNCPGAPLVLSAIHCSGAYTPAAATSFALTGTVSGGGITCEFDVTGNGTHVEGRLVGADKGIWGNPSFDLGPRQSPAPAPVAA